VIKPPFLSEQAIAALQRTQAGKAGYILLWALGVPIPILFLIYLLRGCS
jgi:cytochrome c biogenesis protein CcdA